MKPGDKVLVFGEHHGVITKYRGEPPNLPVDFKMSGTQYHAEIALADLTLVQAAAPKEKKK